jgi:nucleoid-associated protein EbfC
MADMAKMMKAAQEMQGKMAQLQEDLKTIIVTGSSGAGLVTGDRLPPRAN